MHSYMAVGIYDEHSGAEIVLSAFLRSDFDPGRLSVVGKEHHRDPSADDYRRSADRMLYAGKFGTFWVAGPLTASIVDGMDVHPPAADLSVLGVGLFMHGIPCEAASRYEAAVRSDKYLLVLRGSEADAGRAAAIMRAGAEMVRLHTAKLRDLDG